MSKPFDWGNYAVNDDFGKAIGRNFGESYLKWTFRSDEELFCKGDLRFKEGIIEVEVRTNGRRQNCYRIWNGLYSTIHIPERKLDGRLGKIARYIAINGENPRQIAVAVGEELVEYCETETKSYQSDDIQGNEDFGNWPLAFWSFYENRDEEGWVPIYMKFRKVCSSITWEEETRGGDPIFLQSRWPVHDLPKS